LNITKTTIDIFRFRQDHVLRYQKRPKTPFNAFKFERSIQIILMGFPFLNSRYNYIIRTKRGTR